MVLMGELHTVIHTDPETMHSVRYRHDTEVRQRTYATYLHYGRRVCRKMFCFLNSISQKRLENVKASLLENGLVPRTHEHKTSACQHLPFCDTQKVVDFIVNYAEANAILLPGRIPGYKHSDIQLLPASMTKRQAWHLYVATIQSMATPGRTVGYSTFCRLWKLFLPHIIVTKPNERSMLGLPDKLHSHHEGSQSA